MHNSIRNENDYHAVFESTFRHRQTYYIDTKEISDNRVCWEFSGFFFQLLHTFKYDHNGHLVKKG